MRAKSLVVLLTLSLTAHLVSSQNETNNWYFGYNAGLSFSTSPPSVLLNSSMYAPEGCASISDASGNLLFYSNGIEVWNASHATMANGTGLLGNNSTTQAALIVKQPKSAHLYYLFTLDQIGWPNGLRYSIIDMNLAAGMGSVTVKNSMLHTPSCEKMAAARHCNGEDVWIITHDLYSAQFRVFLLSSTGIATNPVISTIGASITNTLLSYGQLKVSPNSRKIGLTTGGNDMINFVGTFEVYDFDNTNGIISNSLVLGVTDRGYGCEFSPDGSKFYGGNMNNPSITQWNLCAGSNSAILNSMYSVSTGSIYAYVSPTGMQLAKDGKIYFNYGGFSQLGAINNPNNAGAAMNLTLNAISVAPKQIKMGFPNKWGSHTDTQFYTIF